MFLNVDVTVFVDLHVRIADHKRVRRDVWASQLAELLRTKFQHHLFNMIIIIIFFNVSISAFASAR
jgi:hypothetical protein